MTVPTRTADLSWQSLLLYSLAKVGPGLLMFAAVPIWTRLFGVTEYGLYAIFWAAALFSSSFFTGWIRQAVLRHTGNDELSLAGLPRWIVILSVALSVIPVVVVVLVQFRGSATGSAFLIIASSVFAAMNSYYLLIQVRAQRNAQSGRYTLAEVTRISVALVGSVLLWRMWDIQGSLAILIAYSLGTVAAITFLSFGRASDSPSQSKDTLAVFWAFGWPMAVWLTLSSLLVYIDRIILGVTLGAHAAGTYSAVADMMIRGFAMVAFPLTMASHPVMMSRWNRGDSSGAMDINRRYFRHLALLGTILVVGASLVGTTALEFVLGAEIPNPLLVPVLAVGAAAWQLGLMSHKPLEMLNRTRTMVGVIGGIVVASIALNLWLIPIFGLIVPAFVFALGALAYVAITAALGRRAMQMQEGVIHV